MKKKEKKFYTKIQINLSELRRGSTVERIIRFFNIFGSEEDHDPEKPLTIWEPDRVALILGLTEKEYLRGLTRCLKAKKLKRVKGRTGKQVVYSFAVPPLSGLPVEALIALTERSFSDVTYCNRVDLPFYMGDRTLRDLPEVPVWKWDDGKNLKTSFPDLYEFEAILPWKFWPKAVNSVKDIKHPVGTLIRNPDLQGDVVFKLTVALSAVELEVARRLENDPGWWPDSGVEAFVLDGLKNMGRYRWAPRDVDELEKLFTSKKGKTLKSMAHAAMTKMQVEWKTRNAKVETFTFDSPCQPPAEPEGTETTSTIVWPPRPVKGSPSSTEPDDPTELTENTTPDIDALVDETLDK